MTATTDGSIGRARARRALVATTLGIAAIATASHAAAGASADAPATGAPAIVRSSDVLDAAGVDAYWTAERMASATPADLLATSDVAHVDVPVVGATRSADTTMVTDAVRYPPKQAPSGTAVLAQHATAFPVRRPYSNLPDRTVGKVFFTGNRGDQTCSAVALNSANRSVVWTAGHCVEAGVSGGFHHNWVFVPGYGSCSGGCRPYGTFRATTLVTTAAWADDGDFRYDMGAAVVAPVDGRRLISVVGGQGFAAGEPDGATFHSVGYPADPPFNGRRQLQCTGASTGRDDVLGGAGPAPVAMACDMTGGASGGPWMIELGSNGYGYVNGNTSYRYNADPATFYSPHYGDEAAALYLLASSAPIR